MLWSILLIPLLSIPINGVLSPKQFATNEEFMEDKSYTISQEFAVEYLKYMSTGIQTYELYHYTNELLTMRSNDNWAQGIADDSYTDLFVACTICRATMNIAFRMFRFPYYSFNGPNRAADAKRVVLDMCKRFRIQSDEVCEGMFDVYWPLFDYFMQNSSIETHKFCGFIPIPNCAVKPPEYNGTLKINNDVHNTDKPKSEKPLKGAGDLKILQITDLHYDPEYKPGAAAECNEPLCCQRMPGSPGVDFKMPPEKVAGYWGAYHVCDVPYHTLENALDHIVETHTKIQYIYHTGDIIAHIGWKTSKEGHIRAFEKMDELLTLKFPDTPIFPCVGNHDANPSDMFSPVDVPEAVNTKWIYEQLYALWSRYLPASTKSTILKGGYYTVSPHAGFRIIALNNIDCYTQNWWIYYNSTVAMEQLQWLHDTLLAAEKANEYVHILSHIPSGEADCSNVWSHHFNRLVTRFNHIISGIFNGHTHKDEMNVHYSKNGHAVGIAWNGGSLTTYIGKNPNYRVYDVEQRTMQVVDYETWTFNLTAANQHGSKKKPVWYKLCQFSKDFTDDLSPAGINDLLLNMSTNPALVYKYWRCKITASDRMLTEDCGSHCLMDTICALAKTSNNETERCDYLRNRLRAKLPLKKPTKSPPTVKSGADISTSISVLNISILLGICGFIKLLF